MKLLDRMSDQWFRNIVSQPERVGQTEYVDRNPYNIAHPLKESHWLPRTILAMLPKGGLLSGFTQEDYARLQDPTDRTLFGGDPTGNPRWSFPPITERGLAKFGLFTDALDWLPGAAVLGGTTRLFGRGLRGKGDDVIDALTTQPKQLTGPPVPEGGTPAILAPTPDPVTTVFHASPYEFEQFDPLKIGQGVGKAVRGPGTYVAEDQDQAFYALTAPGVSGADRPEFLRLAHEAATQQNDAAKLEVLEDIFQHDYDRRWMFETPDDIRTRFDLGDYSEEVKNAARELADELEARPPPGYLYQVSVSDDATSRMLNWEKAMDDQPEAVQRLAKSIDPEGRFRDGDDFMRALGDSHGEKASAVLEDAGVPGIIYLDQPSHKRISYGEADIDDPTLTSNMVLFDELAKAAQVMSRTSESQGKLIEEQLPRDATPKPPRPKPPRHRKVGTSGQIVGAPTGVDSPGKLRGLRKNYLSLVMEGQLGRHWYEDASEWISDVGGSQYRDPLAAALARTSSGTAVDANLGHALKAHQQMVTDTPRYFGRFPNDMRSGVERAYGEAAAAPGQNIQTQFGPKLDPYFEN